MNKSLILVFLVLVNLVILQSIYKESFQNLSDYAQVEVVAVQGARGVPGPSGPPGVVNYLTEIKL